MEFLKAHETDSYTCRKKINRKRLSIPNKLDSQRKNKEQSANNNQKERYAKRWKKWQQTWKQFSKGQKYMLKILSHAKQTIMWRMIVGRKKNHTASIANVSAILQEISE